MYTLIDISNLEDSISESSNSDTEDNDDTEEYIDIEYYDTTD